MKAIAFSGTAARQRARLDPQVRARIDAKIDVYAVRGEGDVKRLKGQEGTRLRVGDWRVIFSEDRNTITVMAIGHRREIYD